MERFNGLGRGAQLMLIGGVLLFIDMFFAWQKVDLGPLGDYTRKGWYGAAGVILGILTIILLAWLIVRLASVNIPLPVSSAMSAAVIGVLILIFAIIKLISILGDAQTFWAWLGVAFAVVIVVGAFMAVQEAGGVDTLRSEASGLGSSMSTSTAAAPAATQPAAPAPPPAPAPEQTSAPPPGPAASDTTDAASDATSDEPSTERES
jgi:Na+/melibiose symporter-like transporter